MHANAILVFFILFYLNERTLTHKNSSRLKTNTTSVDDDNEPQPDKEKNECVLPKTKQDVNYTIVCSSKAPCPSNQSSGIVPVYTMLSVKCPSGFLPEKHFQKKSICLANGEWLPTLIPCSRICKKLNPENVELACTHNYEKVDCNKHLLVGTVVIPSCKPGYKEEDSSFESLLCQEDGTWSADLPRCTPICGRLNPGAIPLIMDGRDSVYGESPWHVAIYIKNTFQDSEMFDLICSGTIITAYLVISSGHCFYDEISKKEKIPQDYQIMVSKITRYYSTFDNDQTKAYNVSKIYFPEASLLSNRNAFQLNLALIEAQEKIRMSPVVLPACLTWDSNQIDPSFSSGTLLKVNGWGFNKRDRVSEILQTTNLTYITRDECIIKATQEIKENYNSWLINYLTIDKLCAGTDKGPRISPGDNGGGLLYQDKNNFLYHLQGVLGHKENLGTTSITAFTNILFYMNWINKIKNEVLLRREKLSKIHIVDNKPKDTPKTTTKNPILIPPKTPFSKVTDRNNFKGCILPLQSSYNFNYEITCPNECKDATSGSLVPHTTALQFQCNDGYMFDLKQEPKSVCIMDKWFPAIIPCKKICRKLKPKSTGLLLKCTYKDTNVNCGHDLREGTTVYPRCLSEYRPEYSPDFREIICHDDGEWNVALFRCVPICGRRSDTSLTPLIGGGENTTLGEFPWHVAIYDKKRLPPDDLICGGTIITEYIILSAAHCFYDKIKEVIRNASEYEIMVSKISRDYNIMDSITTQSYKIKSIYANNYRGITFNFQNDIAILEMESKIIFKPTVLPACVYYQDDVIIPSQKQLMVAGWGLDSDENISPILRVAKLKYYSINECANIAPPELKLYLSPQSFCVGSKNSSLEKGDSGGGIFYPDPNNNFYYLVGIVSFKAAHKSSITTITRVDHFKTWIIKIRDKIHKSRLET